MSPLEPIVVIERQVALDYGQFYLYSSTPDDDLSGLIDSASTHGYATDGHTLVVLSPHQNNFLMNLRLELYEGLPASDVPDWELQYQICFDIGGSGLYFESPTVGTQNFDVPTGSYYLEVSGRGFKNRGWPGSTKPGDAWRIRIWPATSSSIAATPTADGPSAEPYLPTMVASARERLDLELVSSDYTSFYHIQDGTIELDATFARNRRWTFRTLLTVACPVSATSAEEFGPVNPNSLVTVTDAANLLALGLQTLPVGNARSATDLGFRLSDVPFGISMAANFTTSVSPLPEADSAELYLNWNRAVDAAGIYGTVLPKSIRVQFSFEEINERGSLETRVNLLVTQVPRTWLNDFEIVWGGYLRSRTDVSLQAR